MSLPVVLRIFKDGELFSVKQFTDGQIVIGRSPEAQLQIQDDSVSVIHAAIELRDSGYYVCDLGSQTGTTLNGENILDVKINGGDVLQIGAFKIEFYVGVPKPKAPPVAEEQTQTAAPAPEPVAAPSAPLAPPPAIVDVPAQSDDFTVSETIIRPIDLNKLNEPEATNGDKPTAASFLVFPKVEASDEKVEIKTELPPPKAETPEELAASPPLPQEELKVAPIVPPTPIKIEAEVKPAPETPKEEPVKIDVSVSAPPKVPSGPPATAASSVVIPASGPTPPASAVKPAIVTQTPLSVSAIGKVNTPAAKKPTVNIASGGLEVHAPRVPLTKPGLHKKKQAFAPKSRYSKVDDFVRPSRGTVVEVLVAWRERVISTYHFSKPGTITFGSHPDADIQLPLTISKQRKVPLLKIDSRIVIMISPEMTGELIKQGQSLGINELTKQNRLVRQGAISTLALDQGEMMKLDLGDVSIVLRYVSEAPKPLIAPALDLTTAESVGVIFALVLVAILAIYNYLYTPPKPLDADNQQEDPARQAIIIVKPPPRTQVVEMTPAPTATPPPTKSTPTPTKMEAKTQPKKESIADESKKKDNGKAAEAAPNKEKTPTKIVGIKKGGSFKTADSAAAQVQSKPKKDLTKAGVFSVFGGGGKNNELAKETAGAGELAGLSNQATGRSGLNENRSGEGLGTIYDTGRGGNGTAAVGRPDVKGGNGRGTGNSGYGSGGIGGGRQGVKIQPGGNEESFSGTIDREAIRRVIQANLKAIKACYEKQLNRKPDLFGKLVIEWDIGERGRVMRARVKSTELNDAEVGSCVVNHLKTWTFPEPPSNNEVTVSYPFFFSN